MATVLISGGTGLIGQALTKELIAKGYDVVILSRQSKPSRKQGNASVSYAQWDIHKQHIDKAAIQKADFIVHLAGANLAEGRWTEKRKKEIVRSRTQSAALLVKALKEVPNKVKAIVSASAIGWYGPDPILPNPKPFVETDPAEKSFLGHTCQLWEASLEPVIDLGIRLVKLRTGIVLSNNGGAYPEFKKPLMFKAATILGSGKQIVSWIHLLDVVGLYVYALENEKMQGPYNAVSPQPVTNKKLILSIARAHQKFFIPVRVPAIAIKIVFGELSIEVLKSATVSSQKVQMAGYNFMFPSLEAALHHLESSR